MRDEQALQSVKSVEVVDAMGEWFVRVCDGNGQCSDQTFEIESYARAFAEGQRIRLGLERFTTV